MVHTIENLKFQTIYTINNYCQLLKSHYLLYLHNWKSYIMNKISHFVSTSYSDNSCINQNIWQSFSSLNTDVTLMRQVRKTILIREEKYWTSFRDQINHLNKTCFKLAVGLELILVSCHIWTTIWGMNVNVSYIYTFFLKSKCMFSMFLCVGMLLLHWSVSESGIVLYYTF